ncbi:hypothetical protein NIES4074_25540 [Cylindrospermum sp. NIES-4074]|nr:hypothetical protein NIES4074_25540 [Cylindrospermum sp. NIES-4074]
MMFHKSILLLAISLWGVTALPLPNRANAATPLTRAEIQNLRNLVQLIPKNNPTKLPARKLDKLSPGDGLSTGRASLADLRFNDGSIARVGEQAVFQFLPKTRDFKLTNGTVLLLIPPGQGQTRIQTPSAAAAIRGSALFVRYQKETDTTIVGALTNSGIEVANKEASQNYVLQAGQLMVVVKGQFQGLYDFDLRTFYETSDLVQGLDLTGKNGGSGTDAALASVQAETTAALAAQSPITGQGVVDNPPFLQGTTSSANSPSNDFAIENSPANSIKENLQVDTVVETAEFLLNTTQRSVNSGNSGNQNNGPGNSDGIPGGGNTNNQNNGPGNSDGIPGGGNTNNQNNVPGNSDGIPGGGNNNNQSNVPGNSDGIPGGGNTNNQTNGPGNSDGIPGGGNTNNQTNGPGNSDGIPGGGNTNNQTNVPGNSDGIPGGGNTNNQTNGPGNSDGIPGGGNTNNQTNGPGNSDGIPGGGNTNNQTNGPGNSDGIPGGGNTNNQTNGPGNSDKK